MNNHPQHLLPAFVLDALNDEDTRLVAQHLRVCSVCLAEVTLFYATTWRMLQHPPAAIPPHIKQQLFARVAAAPSDVALPVAGPLLATAPPRRSRWMPLALVFAISGALFFGTMMVAAQRHLASATTALQQIEQRLDEQQQIIALISDTRMTSLALVAHQPGAAGQIVMRPGQMRMVLVVRGLPALTAQHVYQFWFATPHHPVPSRTFTVGADGSAELLIFAAAPVNQYTQVMVTIEPSGGSVAPSEHVVLSAAL